MNDDDIGNMCSMNSSMIRVSIWNLPLQQKITKGEQGKDKTFSACTTVRGKPSKMNPFEQEGLFRASSMIPTTRSSVTSSPCPFPFGIRSRVIWMPFNLVCKTMESKEKDYAVIGLDWLHTLSMAALAWSPKGVFLATAARSMSPVARWHRQKSSLMMGDWVPFPQPGGPANPKNVINPFMEDTLHEPSQCVIPG